MSERLTYKEILQTIDANEEEYLTLEEILEEAGLEVEYAQE